MGLNMSTSKLESAREVSHDCSQLIKLTKYPNARLLAECLVIATNNYLRMAGRLAVVNDDGLILSNEA